jgi:hypothetical protein
MMVAAETNRDLIYFTFNDENTVENLKKIVSIIEKHNLNVGQVYELINEYANEIRHSKVNTNRFGICQFLDIKFSEAS